MLFAFCVLLGCKFENYKTATYQSHMYYDSMLSFLFTESYFTHEKIASSIQRFRIHAWFDKCEIFITRVFLGKKDQKNLGNTPDTSEEVSLLSDVSEN